MCLIFKRFSVGFFLSRNEIDASSASRCDYVIIKLYVVPPSDFVLANDIDNG